MTLRAFDARVKNSINIWRFLGNQMKKAREHSGSGSDDFQMGVSTRHKPDADSNSARKSGAGSPVEVKMLMEMLR